MASTWVSKGSWKGSRGIQRFLEFRRIFCYLWSKKKTGESHGYAGGPIIYTIYYIYIHEYTHSNRYIRNGPRNLVSSGDTLWTSPKSHVTRLCKFFLSPFRPPLGVHVPWNSFYQRKKRLPATSTYLIPTLLTYESSYNLLLCRNFFSLFFILCFFFFLFLFFRIYYQDRQTENFQRDDRVARETFFLDKIRASRYDRPSVRLLSKRVEFISAKEFVKVTGAFRRISFLFYKKISELFPGPCANLPSMKEQL